MILAHFDKDVEDFNFEMTSDVASSNIDFLDGIADDLGVTPLSRFLPSALGKGGEAPPNLDWYMPEEGLTTLATLLSLLSSPHRTFGRKALARRDRSLERVDLLEVLCEELEDLQNQLAIASAQGAKFNLTLT